MTTGDYASLRERHAGKQQRRLLSIEQARAALEATCLQAREVVRAMGGEPKALKVDGGMVVNDLLMQFQADMLGVDVVRPEVAETTLLAALAEYQLLYLSGISLAVLILNVALPVLARRRYLQDEARRLRREESK